MNAISYSLFGYNNKDANSLDLRSYMRGLEINMRVAELLYPEWKICVATDEQTYFSPYKEFFTYHQASERLDVQIVPRQPLCMMMLHRMSPIFSGHYDRIICRDTDSLLSYRERQAVGYWINRGLIAHSMGDSISHTVTLMGGMIGFMCKEFIAKIGARTFEEMVQMDRHIDYNVKGSDQTFLNKYILPRVADNLTEHFVLGMPDSFRGDFHRTIQNIDLGMPEVYKELDNLGYHIGASGMKTDHIIDFLKVNGKHNDYFEQIEKKFPDVFYWQIT